MTHINRSYVRSSTDLGDLPGAFRRQKNMTGSLALDSNLTFKNGLNRISAEIVVNRGMAAFLKVVLRSASRQSLCSYLRLFPPLRCKYDLDAVVGSVSERRRRLVTCE